MKFDEALLLALSRCEKEGIDDPFYLYSVLSDGVGADFAGKEAAKMLYEVDRRLGVVKGIEESGLAACAVCKTAYPAFKGQYPRKRFCDFIDDVYCILTHTPRKERQSIKTCAIAQKGRVGKKKGKGQAQPPVLAPAAFDLYADVPSAVPPKYRGLWLLRQAIGKPDRG